MKLTIKKTLQAILIVPVLALGVAGAAGVIASPVSAVDVPADCTTDISGGAANGLSCAKGAGQQTSLFGTGGIFTTVTNVLLFIIGAISVIMLIIGGIRYTVSGGDSSAVTGAKNTIMYAIVGIIIALLAYALVNFVLTSLGAPKSA